MKKQLATLCIAVCGTVVISCGPPHTERAGEALSYDKVHPGTRVSANLEGVGFGDDLDLRSDTHVNHDEHANRLEQADRPTPPAVPDTMKANQKEAVENHE